MRKMTPVDVDSALHVLKKRIDECIYLYIDLKEYGTEDENVSVWMDQYDDGELFVMKYYDSFQIFSSTENWDISAVKKLIDEYGVTTICGPRWMIEKLENICADTYYTGYGVVVKESKYREFGQFDMIKKAVPEQAMAIAQLMCTDAEFSNNYDVEILAKQLADRIKSGVGENYVIEENGEIQAHVGVFAQTDSVAVESGLIVSEYGAKKLYGMIIHEYVKKVLIDREKAVYAFRIKRDMLRATSVTNATLCGEYGKMTRSK